MKQRIIHPGNFECFMEVYAEQLKRMHSTKPEVYAWPMSELSAVLGRMRGAIERGSFNKDSPAFKATCKQLNIKHTYQAINEFILTIGETK